MTINHSLHTPSINIIYSNSLTRGLTDLYVKENEIVHVAFRDPGNLSPKPILRYLYGPLGKDIAIYATKTLDDTEILFFIAIQTIRNSKYDIIDVLNNIVAISYSDQYIINYYMEIL
jgi:hypothetical protein